MLLAVGVACVGAGVAVAGLLAQGSGSASSPGPSGCGSSTSTTNTSCNNSPGGSGTINLKAENEQLIKVGGGRGESQDRTTPLIPWAVDLVACPCLCACCVCEALPPCTSQQVLVHKTVALAELEELHTRARHEISGLVLVSGVVNDASWQYEAVATACLHATPKEHVYSMPQVTQVVAQVPTPWQLPHETDTPCHLRADCGPPDGPPGRVLQCPATITASRPAAPVGLMAEREHCRCCDWGFSF